MASCGRIKPSWRRLEASWRGLGPSWRRLGAFWKRLRSSKARNNEFSVVFRIFLGVRRRARYGRAARAGPLNCHLSRSKQITN